MWRSAEIVVLALLHGGCTRVGFPPPQDKGTPADARASDGSFDRDTQQTRPELLWNTFLGGTQTEYGKGLAVDSDGSIYVSGQSMAAWGNPVRSFSDGNWDAYVTKLDADGNLLWNTFLGGSTDGSADWAGGLALDGAGGLYVVGTSGRSWGSPLRPFTGDQADGFVAKLDTEGNLIWNTFLGGDGEDSATAIAYVSDGAVVVGGTSAAAWPAPTTARTFAGEGDAYLAKLLDDGTLVWNTFLGSSAHDSYSSGRVVADDLGYVYTTGLSEASWGAPQRDYVAAVDAFVAKVDQNGALIWNTFLGGEADDEGRGIARDGEGDVLLTGLSESSWGEPQRSHTGGASDAFAAKLDGKGHLLWHTFLGGDAPDIGDAIVTSAAGDAYLTGHSRATWGHPVQFYAGGRADAFVVKLDAGGGLRWHTFLGGNGGSVVDDDYGEALALTGDHEEEIMVVGDSRASWATPRRPLSGGGDTFAAKLREVR